MSIFQRQGIDQPAGPQPIEPLVDADQPEALTGAPLWFEYLILAGCSAVLGCGGIGLLLADTGHFSAPLAIALGLAFAVVGVVIGRPRLVGPSAPVRRATLPALTMCVVAGGITIWNMHFIGHHVVVNNDPGVYAMTGRWLADHRSLVVNAGGPWAFTALKLKLFSAGIYVQSGTVQFQFAHFSPTLLAEAYKVGGAALMFRTPALLGALGLGAVYSVGCRLVSRPWVVVAAVTALGVSLPELSVTRDTFSEPSTQVLLWFGIWLLMRSYEERRLPVALLAGLAIGGTLMTHIDAVVYLIPLPPLAAVAWLAARSSSERRSLLRVFAGVLIGLLPPVLLGTFDVRHRSGAYYENLRPDVVSLYHSLALATLAAVVVMVVWPTVRPLRTVLISRRTTIGTVVGAVVAAGLLLAWSLRPAGPKAFGSANPITAGLQMADNLPIQPGRTYAELSVRWMEWYLGPVALGLAIAGLCYLTARIISRGSPRSLIFLVMTGPVTAIYLWKPAITPYQVWALRRFVPAALPLLVLAAALMLDVAVTFCVSRFAASPWPRRTLGIGMAGLIAFPLGATIPVRSFQPQDDNLGLVNTICKTIGPHAAVLFTPGDFDGAVLMQTMRSWCGVPAAGLQKAITRTRVATIVTGLRAEGRTLWILAASAQVISSDVPGSVPHLLGYALNDREIQGTLTQPADAYAADAIAVYGASISG